MKKDYIECIEEGRQLKEYRTLMGIKQIEMSKNLNVNQANYCHMEQGRINCGNRLVVVREMFKKWRVKEIEKLNQRIKYLNSI